MGFVRGYKRPRFPGHLFAIEDGLLRETDSSRSPAVKWLHRFNGGSTVNRTLCTAVFLTALAPTALAASSVEKFRNEKVAVTESTLAPGEQEPAVKLPSLIVYMSNGTVQIVPASGATRKDIVKEGDTAVLPEGTGTITNAGSAPLHIARISFLTMGGPETWGKTGLAPGYTLLVENKSARVYEIKIPPGAFEPQHTHHDRVVVALSGAQLEHILPDGTKQSSTLKTGEIAWRPAATHVGHNLGATPLWVIAIEPK
jgi:quercetin dioxygenase-like cupin family protein